MSAYRDIAKEIAAAATRSRELLSETGRRRRRGWLSLPPDDGAAGRRSPGDETPASLRAEVLLLREENARLKLARRRGPDAASIARLSRALADSRDDEEGDEAAQVLIQTLAVRQSLVEICRELEQSMAAFQAKLDALVPDYEDESRGSRDAVSSG